MGGHSARPVVFLCVKREKKMGVEKYYKELFDNEAEIAAQSAIV